MRFIISVVSVFLLAIQATLAIGKESTETLADLADPATQQHIRGVYDAKGDVEIATQLARLNALGVDKAELVKQLAFFAAAAPDQREFHDVSTLCILDRLSVPPVITIRVLAPYLGSEHAALRGFATLWFKSHDTMSYDPLEPVNYEDYARYVRQALSRNEDIPTAFVQYIFERSPERALLVFYRGNHGRHVGPRMESVSRRLQVARTQERLGLANEATSMLDGPPADILLAAQIVGNAIRLKEFDEPFQQALPEARARLEALSQHSEFWVRLYVAEMMRQHPELRADGIVESLRKDDDESVKKAARAKMVK